MADAPWHGVEPVWCAKRGCVKMDAELFDERYDFGNGG
jgi:hypothetical protein